MSTILVNDIREEGKKSNLSNSKILGALSKTFSSQNQGYYMYTVNAQQKKKM